MTAKSQVEYVVPTLGGTPPAVVQYLESPSGHTVLLLTRVARVVGAQAKGDCVRIYCLRLRRATLPPDITVHPWPREKRGRGRPRSRAAGAPSPSDKPAIVTQQQRQRIERDRIRALRLSYKDLDNALIAPERRQNRTAVASTWRDPLDVDALRRKPRAITGFRATDPLETLQNSGTLNRQQVGAARRLRRDYENGCLQTNGALDWERGGVSVSGTPIGVSERRLQFLERFENARRATGRLFDVIEVVCLREQTLRDYAALHKIHPAAASGRLYSALQALQDHYDAVDPTLDEKRQRPVHTIGSQMGPVPAEGSPADLFKTAR